MNPLRKSSISLSLPKAKAVRGCEVKRMPLGAFLAAMERLQDFPALLMEGLFPGQSMDEILAQLKGCTGESLVSLLARAVSLAPRQMLSLAADLTGIGESRLLEDADIGPAGLAEILTAWAEVNELENFTRSVSALVGRAKALAGSGGSSG